jgi:hypothetical protein
MTYGKEEPEIVVVDIAAEETVSLMQQKEVDPMNSGFSWYTPPQSKTKEHLTGGHEWMISGHDMQVLTSTLPPGEAFITETGSFLFGSGGIKTTVELTCCTRDSCYEGVGRILGGENCVKVLLRNEGTEEAFVGITPNFPAKIVPVKVSLACLLVLVSLDMHTCFVQFSLDYEYLGYLSRYEYCTLMISIRDMLLAFTYPSYSLLSSTLSIKFGTHINEDGYWIAQGGSYMSSLGDVDVGKSSILFYFALPCLRLSVVMIE